MTAPVALYRAPVRGDAATAARDGQPILEARQIDSSDAEQFEVRFGDGRWMLARSENIVPAFTVDTMPERRWLAHRYDERWNGWATPVVDRFVVRDLLAAVDEPHRWEGDSVYVGDDEQPWTPDSDGLYHSAFLGWTFIEVDPSA